ncbi:uncharacterized protein Z518_01139 [Rhinocladiella mackenziei CBS 650.93]|uniref:Rhinocladiella mackenziei CBS 650.93 unplaced genomic scaffold supercont1.1, whole genome shotgun sequence n=1 Tax=Rhinocladiella mackenziei CBS 650.93 TaxID=1442369 RepID=A0A0D2HHF0_9EURO|nr:uncharacterized protein Z518_01139 [Rhinocladiella mackenziei CBS 650.93]KIX10058.1 hypothetical protein Z518_01139 [Rhinocladiella mackenziei CBS 650.93]
MRLPAQGDIQKDDVENLDLTSQSAKIRHINPKIDVWNPKIESSFTRTEAPWIAYSHYERTLMSFYGNVLADIYVAFGKVPHENPMVKGWLSTMVRDEVLATTVFTISSLYLAISRGEVPTAYLRYKGKAIHAINTRFSDTSTAVSNEVLAAIALLVMVPALGESVEEIQIHLHGMLQLLRLCGGLESMGDSSWVRVVVRCQPSIPVDIFVAHSNALSAKEIELHDRLSNARLESLAAAHGFSKQVTHALVDLKLLSTLRRANISADEAQNLMISYTERLAVVMRTLSIATGSGFESKNSYVEDACCLAGTLFCTYHLLGYPSRMAVVVQNGLRLQQKLGLTDPDEEWDQFGDILLSVLFAGAYASAGQLEGKWYLSSLKMVSEKLGGKSWAEIKTMISSFLYAQELESEYLRIWNDACGGIGSWPLPKMVRRSCI